jgi:hypothetical protein
LALQTILTIKKEEYLMPGILYHLSFAEQVYRRIADNLSLNKVDFMAGNLIPDLAADKNSAHYSIKASHEGFWVPDMELVARDLFVPTDSVKFGMFCHLYMDYHFIEEFLIPEFIWDEKNDKVINPRNGKEWDIKTFFSHSGMYGSYTEINQLMIKDGHIPLSTVAQIPDVLPNSGLPVFDKRRERTWRDELDEYLGAKKEYTGDVFDYERLWSYIEKIASQFVNEVLK